MPRDKTAHLLLLTNPERLVLIKVLTGHCRMLGRNAGEETTIPIQAGGLRLIPSDTVADMQDRLADITELENAGLELDPEAFTRMQDALIEDPTVSNHHVMFYNDGGELAMMDMGSRNGTLVNGQQVVVTHLAHGDLITVGESKLRVE